MKLIISILLLSCAGIYFIPTTAACDMEVQMEMSCCQKEYKRPTPPLAASCTLNLNHHQNIDHGCEDHCPAQSCSCNSGIVLTALFQTKDLNIELFGDPKTELYTFIHTRISTGYLSIWLPPKIG